MNKSYIYNLKNLNKINEKNLRYKKENDTWQWDL